jgi:hypothetical protein
MVTPCRHRFHPATEEREEDRDKEEGGRDREFVGNDTRTACRGQMCGDRNEER